MAAGFMFVLAGAVFFAIAVVGTAQASETTIEIIDATSAPLYPAPPVATMSVEPAAVFVEPREWPLAETGFPIGILLTVVLVCIVSGGFVLWLGAGTPKGFHRG